jgi:hypothetical protein
LLLLLLLLLLPPPPPTPQRLQDALLAYLQLTATSAATVGHRCLSCICDVLTSEQV